jgi:hypothetical protein
VSGLGASLKFALDLMDSELTQYNGRVTRAGSEVASLIG